MLTEASQARDRAELAACFEALAADPLAPHEEARAYWRRRAAQCREGLGEYAAIPVAPRPRGRPPGIGTVPPAPVPMTEETMLRRREEIMAQVQRALGIEREPGADG